MMIREGYVVRVPGGKKAKRPGVILRLLPEAGHLMVFAPWGTGTFRADFAHVAVMPRSRAGTALRVEKPTYFYQGNVTICDANEVEPLGVPCPPSLLTALQALVGL